MATTIIWHGGSGKWATQADWTGAQTPLAGDDVLLGAAGAYTVTLDSIGVAANVSLGAGATLELLNQLALSGTFGMAAGASLALDGLISGGTLNLATGGVSVAGGTLEGVTVLGGFASLPNLTIDAATAADSASGGTIAVGGSLALMSGTYDTTTFALNQTGGGTTVLTTAPGAAVTFGSHATVALTQDPAQLTGPLGSTVAGLAGGGAILNDGTITSDVSNPAGVPLAITVASFDNAGVMQFTPLQIARSGTFQVSLQGPPGHQYGVSGTLNWTAAFAPTLDIGSAGFVNTGRLSLGGGTLDLSGATVANAGAIVLSDAQTQTVTADPSGNVSVVSSTLTTAINVSAGAFSNTGTLSADTIDFSGAVTLNTLGTLTGALVFAGTLDLGGGTLDASRYASVSITGTVENGTLAAGTGTLSLAGATLDKVAVLPGAAGHPAAVVDPPSGSAVTLDAATTRLDLSGATTADLTVSAGSTQATDIIRIAPGATPAAGGTVTLGHAFTLTANVAGSTVDIAGAASTVINSGLLTVNAASLIVGATLDGGGTLALANGAAVTLDALAATATPTVDFGAGSALLVVPGTGALGLTLVNLHAGDVLDFLSVSSVSPPGSPFGAGGAAAPGTTLDVQGASGAQASLPVLNPASGLTFSVAPDGSGGSLVYVACFAAGTRIATPRGDAPVETLRPGRRVQLARGGSAPVKWVGCTTIDLSRHPDPARAAPIRIRADAFGPGRPCRDLLVSPEHCLLVDGALVPAGRLTNGASIARDDGFGRIDYWHVELARHDILLAEGLPAESYLDTGNRALFAGEAGVRALHADLAGAPDAAALAVWAAHGAAPLRLDAPDQRAALAARARALGWEQTDDAGLWLANESGRLACAVTAGGARALLPAGTRRVWLHSRSFVPAETQAGSGDTRRLGVALRAANLSGWPPHPDAFAAGWHDDDGAGWRWTNGAAALALPRLARASVLELHLARSGRYWRPAARSGLASGTVATGSRAA